MSAIFRSIRLRFLPLFVLPVLLLAACENGETLEGTLRAVDCVDGEMTVVTEEGKTFVMTIETPDCEAEQLQEGQNVRVDTSDDQRVVHNVTIVEKNIEKTTVIGKVVNVHGDRVTVRKDDGEEVTVRIDPGETEVEGQGDGQTNIQDLHQDVTVVINVDQETNVAQTIEVQEGGAAGTPDATPTEEPQATPTPEPAESPTPEPGTTPTLVPEASPTGEPEGAATPDVVTVTGVVTSIADSSISIQTDDGQALTVELTSETTVVTATEADLSEGDQVLVEMDSSSQTALEIHVQAESEGTES